MDADDRGQVFTRKILRELFVLPLFSGAAECEFSLYTNSLIGYH